MLNLNLINTNHDYDGILFIGDLHAISRNPGRRIDNYPEACLDKLKQSASIAKERNLFPVFLGDLFHRPGENNLEFLSSMGRTCKEFNPNQGDPSLIVLGGSHDQTEHWFTAKDAAYLMQSLGVVSLIDQSGKIGTISVKGNPVGLWGIPARADIPLSLEGDGVEPDPFNIAITHHDFDFNGPYPGCVELREIKHCDMLVNGHMHTPTKAVIKGSTVCHNPGSVTRVSVDLVDHKPAVSVWSPENGASLERVELTVRPNVFDLTGHEVYAATTGELKNTLPRGLRLSSFAAKLRAAPSSLEASRTDDGAVLIEELDKYFKNFDKPDNLKRYITGLVQEVVEQS